MKRAIIISGILSLAFGIFMFSQTGIEGPENLLKNPGFETGSGIPASWTIFPLFPQGVRYIWDDTVSRSGSRSACIENTDNGIAMWQQVVSVTPGTVYSISGNVRMENVRGRCNLQVVFRDAGGGVVERIDFLEHRSGRSRVSAWIEDFPHPVFARAPSTAAFAEVNLFLEKQGKVWFDDIFFGKARTGSISGTVMTEAGFPVEKTKVYIWGTDYKTRTNSFGRYTLNNIPDASPRYLLIATKKGYRDCPQGDVDVVYGKETTVNFMMTQGKNPTSYLRVICGFIYRAEDVPPPEVSPKAIIAPALYPESVKPYLLPHKLIDSDHPLVVSVAERVINGLPEKDRTNTLRVSYAVYKWVVENMDHDSVYNNKNFIDTTSGKWQTITGEGWCWGHNFADWLYNPSEMIKEKRGICIEHGRLATALLRALGIPARTAGISETQFWVQLPSGQGYWAAMSTSSGRSGHYRVEGEVPSIYEYDNVLPSILYTFSVDEGPLVHSDWKTKNKCMWRERHPWSEEYEYSPAGYDQALADLKEFEETGIAPKGQKRRKGSKYNIFYREVIINLTAVGDQQIIKVRFPLPINTLSENYMDEVAFWTNQPESVLRTWVEDYNNPPVVETFRWFTIKFDLISMSE